MCKLLLLLLLLPGVARSEEDEEQAQPKVPLYERINAAIDKGVAWLKQRQLKGGSYGPCVPTGRYGDPTKRDKQEFYRIGPTAFTIFTLRKCGVPRKDRTIKAAFKWLKRGARTGYNPDMKRVEGTQFQGKKVYVYSSYESAAIIMMLVQLNRKDPPKGKRLKPVKMSKDPTKPASGWKRDEWKWMHERIQFLIRNPHSRMPQVQINGGGWRYWPPYRKADQDLSATQFALLGLRAAVSAGYPVHLVERRTWRWAALAARAHQRSNGGFSYRTKTPWTAGMTAAGIACLLICKEQITNLGETPPEWYDERIKAGFHFLGRNLDFTRNKRGEGLNEGVGYHYYHLYGIERVGALSGKHEIGGKAWYPRGAKWLVEQQQDTGAWIDATCMQPKDVLGTCFALLFLKKATMPAVTISGD